MKKSAHIKADYAFYAFVTLLGIAGWGSIVLWMHVVTPAGASEQEITFLGTVVITEWILVLLYWKQIRWGYIAGMIVAASGFFGGGAASVILHRLHFTWSVYTGSVMVTYMVVLVHLYASYQCYENFPPRTRKITICGVSGIILVMIFTAGIFSHYSASIYWNYMYNATLQTIDEELETMDTLDEKIQYLMEKGNIPSLVAGIVVNDELVWAQAYGDCDLDTAYVLGSITKPITATAVLQLYEKGLFDLDDDINKYLPFEVRHPQYPDIPVTIRMLLQHQSGLSRNIEQHERYMDGKILRDWAAENFGVTYEYEYDSLSLETFLENLVTPGGTYYSSDVWVDSPPGTGYTYSNLGYDLLGYLVEQITETSFPEYVKEYIFDPLEMSKTGGYAADFAHHAVPHERVYALFSKANIELPLYDRTHIGAGGIRSTLPDLAQFLIAHMNHGRHPNGYQLLNPETVAVMHGKAVSVFNRFFMVGYGMGWEHRSDDPGQYFYLHGSQGHDGGTEGYTCHMWMVESESESESDPESEPKNSYGIILIANIYTYYKPDTLWMLSWNYMLQDVLFYEAFLMAAQYNKYE